MAQPVATAIGALAFAQSRWSPRRRMAVIITAAVGLWALPMGVVYGLSQIFL
jgi:hypothetical protein